MKHFFDIGANVGQTFADFLNPSTEFDEWAIWCFEPSPRHLPALMAEAQKQSARYKEIHVCPFGMRGKSEVARFYQKDDPRGDSFEFFMASCHEPKNEDFGYKLEVPAFGIVEFITGMTKPEDKILLKLDAEGSEYSILTALLESDEACARISEILVEWHRYVPAPGDKTEDEIWKACAARNLLIRKWQF